MSGHISNYTYNQSLVLESGETLDKLEIAYTIHGKKGNPIVWISHGITANSNPAEWWPEMVGPGKFFDPEKYQIISSNALGSCYGTTGPADTAPDDEAWTHTFPTITIRDMVKAQDLLREHLGVEHIDYLLGASLGGQVVLEWSIINPDLVSNLILLATNARHSAWGIAFNESQRLAIQADPSYLSRDPEGGKEGLKAARSIALLSYRGYESYVLKQTETSNAKYTDLKASNYQAYQGEKLVNRFNTHSYVTLSRAMDTHNVGRNRVSIEAALASVKARTLVVSISSDILFPLKEQEYLNEHIRDITWKVIDSDFGHDGFLIEHEKLSEIFRDFFRASEVKNENEIKLVVNGRGKWSA